MKVRHNNSLEEIELFEPSYGKHWNSIYGYLVLNPNDTVSFFYSDSNGEIRHEDVTGQYEIL